jgi:hypothetical protein
MVTEISRKRSRDKSQFKTDALDAQCCVREESEVRACGKINGIAKRVMHVEVLNGSARAMKVAPTFKPVMT